MAEGARSRLALALKPSENLFGQQVIRGGFGWVVWAFRGNPVHRQCHRELIIASPASIFPRLRTAAR